ncbi:MAG: ATP synthase F1 subunit delta [Bacteroidetes bacterium]|nr:ATP synthase F1 subunit delta [Bacteroidota bacterium]
MSEIRVASRYAKSLFDLAGERKQLDRVMADAEAFIKICVDAHALSLMLKSPIVHLDKKWNVLSKLFSKELDPTTMAFIKIVLRKKREIILEDIFKQFIAMYNESKGILHAKVYSAVPVSEKILADIKKYLAKSNHNNVLIETEVQPELLGGFILQYNDKLVDASVSSQLRALRNQLMNNN